MDNLKLWYRSPAAEWNHALPVGNGRLGAMVFGGIERERIQINEESLWDGHPMDRTNPEALPALSEVRRLIFAGRNKEAETLVEAHMLGIPRRIKSYQTLGDLTIERVMAEGYSPAYYSRSLDLKTGVAQTTFSREDGFGFRQEVFASATDYVLMVSLQRLTDPVSARIRLTRGESHRPTDVPNQTVTWGAEGSDRLVLRGQIEDRPEGATESFGLRFEAHLFARVEGGSVRADGDSLIIEDAKFVTLLLTGATSFKGRDPETYCRETLERAAALQPESLFGEAIANHYRSFNRVSLDLGGDPELEKLPTDERLKRVREGGVDNGLMALYFQYGRYLLLASSRPGCLPANLQGIWNEHFNAPWQSDYHTNINIQMNYWLAETTNLAECHEALLDFTGTLVAPGAGTARAHYDCGGSVVHHLTDIFGFTTPADGLCGLWPMGLAWLCQHLYEHYRFGDGDEAYLRERAYPVLREAARFLLEFLIEGPTGALVTCPSHSPENRFRAANGTDCWFTYGSTMDLMIVHELFTNTVAAAETLETDPEFRDALKYALANLQPLQISPRDCRLQEWPIEYDEPEPGHRHISHMYGLYPGDQITPRKTPELAAALRKTIDYRLSHGGGHTGWSRAWIVNAFARLEDGEKAYENLHALLAKSTLPNLFDNHPPFQIDGNFGGAAGIAEMLLQSHAGEIHLLPALPLAWPGGSVTGLRARGGHTVSIKWLEGRIAEATLTAGRSESVRIRARGAEAVRYVKVTTGETVSLV